MERFARRIFSDLRLIIKFMNVEKEDIIYGLAEEAAYSFKGHFKTSDWVNFYLGAFVFIPLVTSLLTAFFDIPRTSERILSFLGMIFAIFALISNFNNNRKIADKKIKEHQELGNQYLELYKEIKVLACDINSLSSEKLMEIQKKISQLDQKTNDLKISFVGRWWSKIRINSEMDLKWLSNKEKHR